MSYRTLAETKHATLATIKERWAKASPGPWGVERSNYEWMQASCIEILNSCGVAVWGRSEQSCLDAEAIAHAPEDIAFLLTVVEAAREVVRLAREHGQSCWECAWAVVAYDAAMKGVKDE